MFGWLLLAAAVAAGLASAIAGAGIGSLLAPLLGLQVGLKLAIAAVALPHLIGSALRLYLLRQYVDRRLLLGFGLTSAAFSFLGAWLHGFAATTLVTRLFSLMLILASLSGLFGVYERLQPGNVAAWLSGALSGFLGGLVGEQGGFRSAALLGFKVEKEAFVATASAIALAVDAARLPVYWIGEWNALRPLWPWIGVASLGVALGTLWGHRLLGKIPQAAFSRVVSSLILLIGILLFVRSLEGA